MFQLAAAVFIVILGSALCSGTETALLSIPLLRAKQLAQNKPSPGAIALLNIRQHVTRPIATIVILNNIFNIVGSIVVGRIATTLFSNTGIGIFSAVLTFAIILFAEILPKTVGERYAENISLIVAIPVRGATVICTPLIWLLEKITAPLTKGNRRPITNESEIRLLTILGYQEGLIEDDEAEMIDRVFRLNDLMAADIMTPRVAITFIPGSAILREVQDEIISSQHTRILVIEEDLDHVIGVALKAELLAALVQGHGEATVKSVMRQVHYVPDTERTDRLIKTFQSLREHLMVVVDEYGGVSGVVTLEDTLEVLTGEIVDETDRNVDLQALARQRQKRILRRSGFRKTTRTPPPPHLPTS
ncbi:conserved domain protein [Synechococcus sp. PCC 7335]|uniref:hemolysin family protein n=1 Tax=Synechococcus sp. (strain ATCC 29403 / PCC 7335) TaxID=91464 RepID=UPI00017ED986|nr:hemolysin family protein [Synechococcus sp. PCC 7335]EDX85128.1 conserved domain protein [Synechococcus sp. PCC 7335]